MLSFNCLWGSWTWQNWHSSWVIDWPLDQHLWDTPFRILLPFHVELKIHDNVKVHNLSIFFLLHMYHILHIPCKYVLQSLFSIHTCKNINFIAVIIIIGQQFHNLVDLTREEEDALDGRMAILSHWHTRYCYHRQSDHAEKLIPVEWVHLSGVNYNTMVTRSRVFDKV